MSFFLKQTPSSAGTPTIRLAPPPAQHTAEIMITDWTERNDDGTPAVSIVTVTFVPGANAIREWAESVGQRGMSYPHQGRRIYVPPHCILSIAWENTHDD